MLFLLSPLVGLRAEDERNRNTAANRAFSTGNHHQKQQTEEKYSVQVQVQLQYSE